MKKSGIYTKSGDNGKTSLIGGTRVSKTHVRLEAYGTIDELNSFVGWLRCVINEEMHREFLHFVQCKLFTVGAYLATETENKSPKESALLLENDIARIETEIDKIDSQLSPLRKFVLPGGNETASRAHICRTITRRAERLVYRVAEEYLVADEVFAFLNRLSDYFFVLARWESNKNSEELYWEEGQL
ncbi:MAG: cob(I)yrinic acid a,c-diamide adenosyltransferase [Dysgonamonadaceae bacterium]|jgi:cob(I)alamin adenosyltransferase|nr:cob(I)yrinic acid a,c-diamide adenosyltransferase [Dysgonamonadaceae bacterium]